MPILPQLLNRFRRIGGNDIFISYCRADATHYSLAMANKFAGKKYFCFLDQYHNQIGKTLPPEIIAKLRQSSALIVIISPAALQSAAMLQEVTEFKKTGRLIIPVRPGEVPGTGPFGELLAGLPVSVESRDSWKKQVPSDDIISRIEGSFTYRKRTAVLRNTSIGIFLFILAGIITGLFYSNKLWKDIAGLSKDKLQLEVKSSQLRSQQDSLEKERGLLKDSVASQKDSLLAYTKSILQVQHDLDHSRKELGKLDDSARALYSANLIGLMKNDQVNSKPITSPSFNFRDINRQMLLALESYKRYRNADAEKVLQDGLVFLPGKILDTTFNAAVIDVAAGYPGQIAVILANGDVYIRDELGTHRFTKLLNVDRGERLYFRGGSLIVFGRHDLKTWFTVVEIATGNTGTFSLPVNGRKISFGKDLEKLFIHDWSDKLYCYNWQDKEMLFVIDGVRAFSTIPERGFQMYGSQQEKIAIWRNDTIRIHAVGRTLGPVLRQIPYRYNYTNDLSFSASGNFAATGEDDEALHRNAGWAQLFLLRSSDLENPSANPLKLNYNGWMSNLGFGLVSNTVYFSSTYQLSNAIHFIEMYTVFEQASESTRILHREYFTKLLFEPVQSALYGIDSSGHLLAWDVSGQRMSDQEKERWRKKYTGDALVQAVCSRLLSNFTRKEWEYYFSDQPWCATCPGLK